MRLKKGQVSALDPVRGFAPDTPTRDLRSLDPHLFTHGKKRKGSGAAGPSGVQGQRPCLGSGAKAPAFLQEHAR